MPEDLRLTHRAQCWQRDSSRGETIEKKGFTLCEQPQLFTMIATVNTGTDLQYTDNKS